MRLPAVSAAFLVLLVYGTTFALCKANVRETEWSYAPKVWARYYVRKCRKDRMDWILQCARAQPPHAGEDADPVGRCRYIADKDLCWWAPRAGVDAVATCRRITDPAFCPEPLR